MVVVDTIKILKFEIWKIWSNFKGTKQLMHDFVPLVNTCHKISYPVLNMYGCFVDFKWRYMIYMIFKWFYMLVPGSSSNDKKSSREKANIGYSKANRTCPPSTAIYTSPVCMENSSGPPPHHVYGLPQTGSSIAMVTWMMFAWGLLPLEGYSLSLLLVLVKLGDRSIWTIT